MATSKINIWLNDVVYPCETWKGSGTIIIFDCERMLERPCSRIKDPEGNWIQVPNGMYKDLRCGHIQLEASLGCYWTVTSYVSRCPAFHLNYTIHVGIGIVQTRYDRTVYVKLYNPALGLCCDWFVTGMGMLVEKGDVGPKPLSEVEVILDQKILCGISQQRIVRTTKTLVCTLLESARFTPPKGG
jgi:hypothetical protein